ncbi:MAG TPA: gliding motility-associated C-terminal domain-containing protein, partial [Bacteroidales bacterium]|nr:gliding motility-associated C-terminal domain-containing protein [Bacteroidales bacterium]
GTKPYQVIWSDGTSTLERTDLHSGTFSVIVSDVNGCTASENITINAIGSAKCIEIKEIITPNNDGFYDTWKIKNIEMFPNAKVEVFNRWGERVFSSKNISAHEWDGTYKEKLLPTDSYHYILYLNDGSKPITGVVTIVR